MKPSPLRVALCAALVLAIPVTRPAAAAATAAPATPAEPARGVLRNTASTNFERNTQTPSAATCTDMNKNPVQCFMQYYGGRVISNVKIYAVAWGTQVDPVTLNNIPGFLSAVSNSDVMDWQSEFNTNINSQSGTSMGAPGTGQLVGRGVYAGGFIISPSISSTNLTDLQITDELSAQIKAKHLPFPDANTIYMTYFPRGSVITQGGSASCAKFCAYHGAVGASAANGLPEFYYAVYPDFSSGGCENGCGNDPVAFNNLCSASTHELIEAVTDPEVSLATGTAFDKPLGWYDVNGGEVGDMCNADHDTITDVNGTTYTVQQMYSQVTGQCQATRTDPQDFKVLLNPNRVLLPPGGNVTLPLTAVTTAGTAQMLALTLTAPPGVTAVLDSASISSDGAAHLTVTAAGGGVVVHDALIIVQAQGGATNAMHTAAVLVSVVNPPSVTLQGAANGATVSGLVTLTANGAPGDGSTIDNVTLSIGGKQVAHGATVATFSWDTTTLLNGTATLTATATDTDRGTASSTVTVTVSNDFTLSVTPAAATATIGGSPTTLTIATTAIGSAESIVLAVSGLPAGVTSVFTPASVTAGTSATLTLTAPDQTPAVASAALTITGTTPSVPAGHAATAQLAVSAKSGCSSTGSSGFLLALTPAFLLLLRRRKAGPVR